MASADTPEFTPRPPRLRVALLGTGRIGSDLLIKIHRSPLLRCTLVAGRSLGSEGMLRAAAMGYPVSDRGINGLVEALDTFDLVFDASEAAAHVKHWEILCPLGKKMIDLTPSQVGHMVVPVVNGAEAMLRDNVNLVTCGGQAGMPIAHALSKAFPGIRYLELVTTAASLSVGHATRLNLDEYVLTTEHALRTFTGVERVKSMLNVSPALPPPDFRNTLSALVSGVDLPTFQSVVQRAVEGVQRYAPGFRLVASTLLDRERAFVTVTVRGRSDLLPEYAGNLDMMNDAAVAIAEMRAQPTPSRSATANAGGA